MFSRTIFKQTLKQNWKLWAIFTALTAIMGALIIAVYDPRMMRGMMEMMRDMPIPESWLDQMGDVTSLLGMLGSSFYAMQGIILPLIFVIMTANSLIASQVDRGSMAYTLSTPITRVRVVSTQAIYMITSVICMFLVVAVVGLGTVQIAHNGLWGERYTADVKAAAEVLGQDEAEVSGDLKMIFSSPAAIKSGADARSIDEDVYIAYLELKIMDNAFSAAAEIMDIDADEISANPVLIKGNEAALSAAADVMGVEPFVMAAMLDQMAMQADASSEMMSEMQNSVMAGITAAAEVLDMDVGDLAGQMGRIKDNRTALEAAVSASGLPEEMFVAVINQQLAYDEMNLDRGLDFDLVDYLNLNLGIFLLMFATSGISFLFSCIFNLTRKSLALGAGIPVAFFIFQIMSQASSDLESFKYLTLNTLFKPADITGGGAFTVQFTVLAIVGAVLYIAGIKVFKEKDLPL